MKQNKTISEGEIVCSHCKKRLDLTNFHRNRTTPTGFSRQCKKCDYISSSKVQYIRVIYNKSHKEMLSRACKNWASRNIDKVKAHALFHRAIKNGEIIRKPCEICGEIKSHGHHQDYLKPLEVVWLCAKHHKAAHGYMTC